MIKEISNCGIGINADLTPEELGDGVWSSASNVRFSQGYAQVFGGMQQVFAAPSVTPYFLAHYPTSTSQFWIHAGLNAVYADDGTTRADITGTAPTGVVSDRWTGGVLNGVLALNNGVDLPMYWGGDVALNLATLPGWNAAWKCASLRPFKNFLIALNITKSTTKYPHMVKWSDVAVPGAIPASWDETNPALDAGENDIAGNGVIVDGLAMGDVFIVYKQGSMWAMSYVGAPYIFRFQRLPGDVGMLARGCAVDTPIGHVVLTNGDVVTHNGSGAVSIANAVIRRYIFDNLSASSFTSSFVTSNPQNNEVWVCFPYGASTTCNRAAAWNWIDKTWSIRTLDNVTYGATGQYNAGAVSSTWAATTGLTWETIGGKWGDSRDSLADSRLLMCHSTPRISFAEAGNNDFGSTIPVSIERTGMHFGDPYSVKTIRAIYPKIDSIGATTVNVEIGSSMAPDVPPTWAAAVPFTVGTDHKVDSFATGRYLSVRFSSSVYPSWRMRSFGIDYVNAGSY